MLAIANVGREVVKNDHEYADIISECSLTKLNKSNNFRQHPHVLPCLACKDGPPPFKEYNHISGCILISGLGDSTKEISQNGCKKYTQYQKWFKHS